MFFRELQNFEPEIAKLFNKIQLLHLCHHPLCQGFVKNSDLFLSVMFMFLEFCIFPCFPVSGYKAKCQILPLRGEVFKQFLQSQWRQCLEFSEVACLEVLLTNWSRLQRLDSFWCSWPWIEKGWCFFFMHVFYMLQSLAVTHLATLLYHGFNSRISHRTKIKLSFPILFNTQWSFLIKNKF